MPEFRLVQISDTHLARRHKPLIENFHQVCEYIDVRRPDLVINSGDIAFDGPANRDDLEFARTLHAALPVPCRYLPGNHDVGDNPTQLGPPLVEPVSEQHLHAFVGIFGEDRWSFDAAGWCFIGLNSLVMNSKLTNEAEQFEWLAQQLASADGKPVALFLHKPLYLNSPDDAEVAVTAFRYVPMPARNRLVEILAPPICDSWPQATSTSVGISLIQMSETFGRPRPVSSSPTPGRKSSASKRLDWWNTAFGQTAFRYSMRVRQVRLMSIWIRFWNVGRAKRRLLIGDRVPNWNTPLASSCLIAAFQGSSRRTTAARHIRRCRFRRNLVGRAV
jgi:Calcineurin-like phosphoesterase